jgi:hypothetical protein
MVERILLVFQEQRIVAQRRHGDADLRHVVADVIRAPPRLRI